jgi:hypothetical protein
LQLLASERHGLIVAPSYLLSPLLFDAMHFCGDFINLSLCQGRWRRGCYPIA